MLRVYLMIRESWIRRIFPSGIKNLHKLRKDFLIELRKQLAGTSIEM